MAHVPADTPIREYFEAGWAARTRVVFENQQPHEPWPPRDASNVLQPWVLFETIGTYSELAAATGVAGNRLFADYGIVYVHVFTPIGEQEQEAISLAAAAGDLFRAAAFYDGPDGRRIRTLAPRISGGGSATDSGERFLVKGTSSDQGQWFRISMSVEYTYWFRA